VFKILADLFKLATATIKGDWQGAFDAINNIALTAVEYLFNNLKNQANMILGYFGTTFDDIKNTITTKVVEWADAIATFFTELPGKISGWFASTKTAISKQFDDTKTSIKTKLDEWYTAISKFFTELPGKTTKLLGDWGKSIEKWAVDQNKENKRQFGEWWKSISEWFTSIPGKLKERLENWKTAISTKWDEIKTRVKSKLTEKWTDISEWFTSAPGKIKGFLENWKTSIAEKYEEIKNTIKTKLDEWWNTIKGWFTSVPEKPEIKNAGKKMIDKVAAGNAEKKQEFIDKLGKIIVEVLGSAILIAGVAAVAAGREIIKNIITGVTASKNGLLEKITDILESIKSKFANLKLSLPKIKLPHFKLSGSFDLSKMQVPSIGVDWYAKGGIFNSPQVIGVGEAGQEAVLPINKLDGIMASALIKADNQSNKGDINITINNPNFTNQNDIDRVMNQVVGRLRQMGVNPA
jgi:uncharacterized protein YjbJ (UPF0337 family)